MFGVVWSSCITQFAFVSVSVSVACCACAFVSVCVRAMHAMETPLRRLRRLAASTPLGRQSQHGAKGSGKQFGSKGATGQQGVGKGSGKHGGKQGSTDGSTKRSKRLSGKQPFIGGADGIIRKKPACSKAVQYQFLSA